jgi:hypothetical protein
MKGPLLRAIQEIEGEDFQFLVKKVNSMTCMESRSFCFLDICNFLAPGGNYASYVKSYGCALQKGYFPYEWVDSLKKLNYRSLPPIESFYSKLRNESISVEEYSLCQRAWEDGNMKTMKDFLIWYNNLDVTPFVEALGKQSDVYRKQGIDMLKSAISLPGLAVRWMFKEVTRTTLGGSEALRAAALPEAERLPLIKNALRSTQSICLFDETNSDLDTLLRNNLVGGPSIVFSRYHEKNVTKLRVMEVGETRAKMCKKVLGVDANALYLGCMANKMPTGYPVRRLIENGLAPENNKRFGKVAHGLLSYLSWSRGERICHQRDGGERRLGQHSLPVDGFSEESRTAYQFHGCFWHGHPCHKTEGITIHPVRKVPMKQLLRETALKPKIYTLSGVLARNGVGMRMGEVR